MQTLISRTTALFPLWAVLFSVVAFYFPHYFAPYKSAIVPLLGVVMFGMGMTLTAGDFMLIFKGPLLIAFGIGMQYLLMPVIAWGISHMFGLPPELTIGMILVGCCPGGTASNVICYLAKADVALSITLTFASTLISFFMTPILTWVYIGQMVTVPVWNMLLSILKIVILPVVVGVMINTLWGRYFRKIKDVFPLVSVAAIVVIIAVIIGLNHDSIASAGAIIVVAVMLHNILGLLSGLWISKTFNLTESQARTLAIEVGMQNSGLGVALAIKYFSTVAALPGALFSIWHNLSGSLLARVWSQSHDRDSDRQTRADGKR